MGLADLLSLVRVPLGALFVLALQQPARPVVGIAILVAAGVSDVLDGWAARRDPRNVGPHRGDWLDPLCDKVFVGAVMGGLFLGGRAAAAPLLLTITRELLQAVAMIVYKTVPALRRRRYNYRAHRLGKATTLVQFFTAAALTWETPLAWPLAGLSAAMGVAAVVLYLRRVSTTAA